MGFFRFRRSIKIFPGIRWNLNKSGSSFTFGGRGYHYTVGNKGSRTTVGLPGTGISYTQVHNTGPNKKATARISPVVTPATQNAPATQSPRANKAGCLFIAGFVALAVWVLSLLIDSATRPTGIRSASLTQPTPLAERPGANNVFSPNPISNSSVQPTQQPSIGAPLRAKLVLSPDERLRLENYIPYSVRLETDMDLPAPQGARNSYTYHVTRGTSVRIVRVNGENLVVSYAGREGEIPVLKTNFLERVIAETEK